MITVNVLYFASLSDLVGLTEEKIEVPEATTVEELLARLEASTPDLKRFQRRFRVAVEQDFVDLSTRLEAGMEVALIPPVSGG